MAARLALKSTIPTRPSVAVVSYSTRQPMQASSALKVVDVISSIAGDARLDFPSAYLVPPFTAEPGSLAAYRRCLPAPKPSRRSPNGGAATIFSLRHGSREVSYLQKYRFSWLFRQSFSKKFIYRCRYQ
ncbi:MAG: hypothetical protein Q6373_014135 [Candidatus Sigynarchaeota archaeon]